MDILKWDDSYCVGVDKVDAQHKLLFKILNDFVKEINNADHDEMTALIKALLNYSDYHFKMEENYLREHPAIEDHKSKHQLYISKILSLQQDLENGKNVSKDMLDFLVSWLRQHILKTDKIFFSGIHDSEGV